MSSSTLATAAGLALFAGLAGPASADTLVGLVADRTLVHIDPASRTVTKTVPVSGGEGLVGIDVRPADGLLYGVTTSGAIITVDPATGAVAPKSMLSEKLAPGVTATVDFNPAADRLRVMGSDGTSLRVNVEDGKAVRDGAHKYAEADAMKGATPKIVAGAYTNSAKGAKATMLYGIDAAQGTIVLQNPPNDGVLNTVGKLGVTADGPLTFEIVAGGEGKNAAWLLTGGKLYAVDLQSGKATQSGAVSGVSGAVTDIAWLPAGT